MALLAALVLMIGLAAPAAAAPDDGQWDPTLPKILSAGAPGDPVAIANASFQASQMALQTTQDLGQKFLQQHRSWRQAAAQHGCVPPVGCAVRRPSST